MLKLKYAKNRLVTYINREMYFINPLIETVQMPFRLDW